MHRKVPHRSCALAILMIGFVCEAEVGAQTAAAQTVATGSAAQPAADNEVAEVIVTARRRDESLERVPISIVAFGPEQLSNRSITSEEDLQSAVPGLTLRASTPPAVLTYAVRGQSVDPYSESSPGVLPYFNDVNANTGGVTQIYDLGSLQVLKGPQGTLFGRNTTGGAVLFNSAMPGNEFGGYLTERLGNYNLRETIAAVDLPIVDEKVLLRIAGDTKRRDGYITNLYDNTKLGQVVQDSIRTTLLLRPIEGLENTTVLQYDDSGGNNANGGMYSVYGPNGVVYSVQAPAGYQSNQGPLTTLAYNFYTPAIGAATWAAYVAAHPKVDPLGIANYVGVQAKNGPYTVDEDVPNSHSGTDYLITNTTKEDFTEHGRLKNIFGLVSSQTQDTFDQDATPYGIESQITPFGSGLDVSRKQLSDELQWSGEALNNDLHYVAGLYAASEQIKLFSHFAGFDLLPLAPVSYQPNFFESTDKQWAGYAQAGYNLSELTGINLTINAGVRWTHDKYELQQILSPSGEEGRGYGAPHEFISASKPSWLVGLDYQVNDGLLLYVTQRGSWRTGGINGQGPPVLATLANGGNVYLPETTIDVEVGAKYRGQFLGVPVTLNVDAFNQWVKNVQRTIYATVDGAEESLVANVPKVQISGFDVDAVANLTKWLQVGGNLTDTNARYTSGQVSYPILNATYNYGPYADTPKWTGTLYAQLHATYDHVGEAVLRADVYAQNYFYFTNLGATVNPGAKIPGYSTTNLRFELNNIRDSKVSASVFARNVLNRTYYTGGLALGNILGFNTVNVAEPRMFGVELHYKF